MGPRKIVRFCSNRNFVASAIFPSGATDRVPCHPLIVLELACETSPAPRERTLGDFKKLQQSVAATSAETLLLIERNRLHESGCGTIDVAWLASILLTPDALLWTAAKKLDALAMRLDVARSTVWL